MKRLLLLAWLTMASASAPHAETLRVLNWEAYLHPEVVELWTRETGVEIEEVYFDSDEDRDAILNDASKSEIDVAVIDEAVSALFGARGRIAELGESTIPNLTHIDPFWRAACGTYSVPYLWGTLGIAYRSDKVKQPPRSWLELLQPDDSMKGHVGMLDDYRDMLAPALFVLGYSLNSDDEGQLKEAFEYLKRQAPSVLTYEYAITLMTNADSLADSLYMALVYGGDQHTINAIVGKPGLWQYSVPQEGTILWVDCLAAISDSPRQSLALQFINFLSRPDISARNAEALAFGTPNNAAVSLMSRNFRDDPSVFPPRNILDRSQHYEVLERDNIILRKRITSAVRKIHESQ